MPPIVSIVGKSGSGKTTFMEKLIREFTSRGYKIATIKHTHHVINFDQPEKDSWRHAQAGARAAMCSSASEVQIIEKTKRKTTVEELARHFGEEYDLILTEGFSGEGNTPKIEIHRKETGLPLLNPANLIALVTDEPLDTKVEQFGLDDVEAMANLLEEAYLKEKGQRMSLYVNGKSIPLSLFHRHIISNILIAITGSLKGVKKVVTLEYRYRNRQKKL